MKIQILVSEIHVVPVEVEVKDLTKESLDAAKKQAELFYENECGDTIETAYSHTTEPETWQVMSDGKIVSENA